MSDLTKLTIAEARSGLASGAYSAAELTEAHIAAGEANRGLNVYVTETPEIARAAAKAADDRRKDGRVAGAMDGIPIAMKDLFCTEGVQTTASSHILEGFTPTYESTVSANLKAAGAVMLGKSNMDEFAMGSATITSYFGDTVNPWQASTGPDAGKNLVPGGSSGGSASAVAARMCLGATGTDTGGSIRQPASFTGIVGMKPTYGRCSRWGIVAFASSLDQAGPMTRTVRDSAIMLGAMAGHDAKDSTSAPVETPDFESAVGESIKGLRVGIPKEYTADSMPEEITRLWEQGAAWLKDQGAEIVDVSLPHTQYALPTYYIVAPAEASANLARYDGVRFGFRADGETLDDMYMNTRGEGFGTEVQRRVLIGAYVLSAGYYDAYYVKAQKVRTRIAEDFRTAFEDVDVLLTPTAPSPAFAIGAEMSPVEMYLNDVFTVPASLAGLPGISVPAGMSASGLPLGLQMIAKPFDEVTLFRAAAALEEAAGFDLPVFEPKGA